MLRLLREWRISRTLDDPRPIPPTPRLDPLSVVHRALRAPAPMRTPPDDLHARTMEAVRRASRYRPAPPARRSVSALYATMGAILFLCGLAGIYAVVAPATPGNGPVVADRSIQPRPATPTDTSHPQTDRGFGSFRLATFVDGISRPSQRLIESSIQAPVRYEAEQLLSDARRAADMVLNRLPFLGGVVQ